MTVAMCKEFINMMFGGSHWENTLIRSGTTFSNAGARATL